MRRDNTEAASLAQHRLPNLASQIRTAFANMAWNTGSSSPGELMMTRSTSDGRRLPLQRLGELPFQLGRGIHRRGPTRVLAFVLVERRPGMPVRLFAPLRDKVTSSAQSLVPFRSDPAKDRACQS